MRADREAFVKQTGILGRDALLALALFLYDELEEIRLKQLENERIITFPGKNGGKKSARKTGGAKSKGQKI